MMRNLQIVNLGRIGWTIVDRTPKRERLKS